MKRKLEQVDVQSSCKIFGDRASADVILCVGAAEQRFETHFGLLASYIPWFSTANASQMSEHQSKVYKFPDDSAEAWAALLKRVYPPNVAVSASDLVHVLLLVDKYGIDWLRPELSAACKKT